MSVSEKTNVLTMPNPPATTKTSSAKSGNEMTDLIQIMTTGDVIRRDSFQSVKTLMKIRRHLRVLPPSSSIDPTTFRVSYTDMLDIRLVMHTTLDHDEKGTLIFDASFDSEEKIEPDYFMDLPVYKNLPSAKRVKINEKMSWIVRRLSQLETFRSGILSENTLATTNTTVDTAELIKKNEESLKTIAKLLSTSGYIITTVLQPSNKLEAIAKLQSLNTSITPLFIDNKLAEAFSLTIKLFKLPG